MIAVLISVGCGGCDIERQESIKIANKGVRALQAGELEVALGYLKKSLIRDPKNGNAANLMGQIYFHDLRSLKEAEKAFLLALEGEGSQVDSHYQLSWLYFERQDKAKANLSVQNCLELEPEHGNCHYFAGQIAEESGDLNAANRSYRKAIEMEPREARAFNALADLYIQVNAKEEAIQVLQEAIRLNTDDANSRQKLASIYMERGQPNDAANLYLEAAQLSPLEHELLFAVGAAYVQAQDGKSASHFLSRYLSNPSDGRKVARSNQNIARVMLENIRRGPRLVAPVGAEE